MQHRHTDHDPVTHACSNSSCNHDMFHVPWVCNCNHAWSNHTQVGPLHASAPCRLVGRMTFVVKAFCRPCADVLAAGPPAYWYTTASSACGDAEQIQENADKL